MEYKILRPHRKGCYATQHTKDGLWSTPWALIHRFEYRAKTGRKHHNGHTRWGVVACNDHACLACAIIKEESILEMIV